MDWLAVQSQAAIAQLGERQTEDLKVPGSIPCLGKFFTAGQKNRQYSQQCSEQKLKHMGVGWGGSNDASSLQGVAAASGV